mmetsp:Transcript_62033/g.200009  ORF Transcript_62033/g.200009 Transcript_62033/m.200009 type:complete len:671 (-) Transcript_62033:53-2065(-)
MMGDLTAKITKEGEDEAKAYHEFVNWCDDMAKNGNFEVDSAKKQKEKLEAKIDELTSAIKVAETKIDELGASLAEATADLKAATEVRTKETKDFLAKEAELEDVIDSINRAAGILEREMSKNPASFAQVDGSKTGDLLQALGAIVDAAGFSAVDKQKLTALIQSRQESGADDEQPGAPAAAAYKSHGSGILDVLEDLKEKTETELGDLRKAETNSKRNFEVLKQSLEDQISADTKDMDDEKTSKAAATEGKATAEGELDKTTKDLTASEQALKTGNKDCMQTAADHDASVKARTEELKTIAQATKVLQETSGGAEDQTYSFLQLGAGLKTRADLASSEVVVLVKNLAKQHHSAALAQLASRISAVLRFGTTGGADPFVKVRDMIESLITSLEKEAEGEEKEKAYCESEMTKTKAKKTDLEDDISRLTSRIDRDTAKSAELKEQVTELQAELAALAKEQSEMDSIRQETHADFEKAKKDLELGLSGVRKALEVLRDYYASDDAAASMIQGQAEQPAVKFHSKSGGAGGSIIGILEVVESDFATGLSKEEMQEADAQSEYDKLTQENTILKTEKDADVKYKSEEIKSLAKNIAELSSDRDTTNEELSAVLDYYDKLKERCIAKPETYEERKKRRDAEIQGLKQALQILEDETAFVQRKRRGSARRGFLVPSH